MYRFCFEKLDLELGLSNTMEATKIGGVIQ